MNYHREAVKVLGNLDDSANLDDSTLDEALGLIDKARLRNTDAPLLNAAFEALALAVGGCSRDSYWRNQFVHLARASLYAHPAEQAGVNHAN